MAKRERASIQDEYLVWRGLYRRDKRVPALLPYFTDADVNSFIPVPPVQPELRAPRKKKSPIRRKAR